MEKDIRELKNIHKGKRAFFIGNGPSLKVSDLELLSNEITFGCNKIYLAFEDTNWRPTYYSITDRVSAEVNAKQICKIPSTKLFGNTIKEALKDYLPEISAYWFNHISRPKDKNGDYVIKFSQNADVNTFGGHAVLFFQLQVAFYMGISEAILLGVDFNYKLSPPTGETAPNGEVLVSEGEKNHFHSNYRERGEKWIKPEKHIQQQSFSLACKNYLNDGRTFLNASRYSELKSIQRISLEEVLAK